MDTLAAGKPKVARHRRPVVAVIGASTAQQYVLGMAEEVGARVGVEGWHLLTGGGGGVMEAACRGFVQSRLKGGGLSIGILPSDDVEFANEFVDLAIPTGMGWARNALVARASEAVIAVGGCSGTLSEIAFAWQMGRPIAALLGSGGWADRLGGSRVDERRRDEVFPARSAEEAVAYLRPKLLNR